MAITTYYIGTGLKNTNVFSEPWTLEVQDQVVRELLLRTLLLACGWSSSQCVLTWPFLCASAGRKRERDLVSSSSLRIQPCEGTVLLLHLTFIFSTKALSPNTVTLGVWVSTYESGEDTIQSTTDSKKEEEKKEKKEEK